MKYYFDIYKFMTVAENNGQKNNTTQINESYELSESGSMELITKDIAELKNPDITEEAKLRYDMLQQMFISFAGTFNESDFDIFQEISKETLLRLGILVPVDKNDNK